MKLVEYIVKIPNPTKEGEYEEFTCAKTTEVCAKLKISTTTMYGIMNKTIKFSHDNKKHLEGIIIEKHFLEPKKVRKPKKTEEEIKEIKSEFFKEVTSS